MTVSKTQARALMDELDPVIREVFARHGLDAPKLSWKYGAWFELKAAGSTLSLGENGINLESPEAQYYARFGHTAYCMGRMTKLEAPLGTKFVVRGTTYVFAGIASKRKKYPIYAYNVDEATYTFFADAVAEIINSAALLTES